MQKQKKSAPKLRLITFLLLGLFIIIVIEILLLYFPNKIHSIYYDFYRLGGGNSTITLYEDGFYPQLVTIKKGDTVHFMSKVDRNFWPASDLHPSHDVYADFDPKRSLTSDEMFSFKFERPGRWKYHDHLDATKTGEIIVLTSDGKIINACEEKQESVSCWQENIKNVLEEKDVDSAFLLMSELYSNYNEFATECHAYAHLIGQSAFDKYYRDNKITLSDKTSMCGYGFYHGFMETLLLTTGDAKLARDFCDSVNSETGLTSAWTACYHGIGHGAIDGSDEGAWGDIQKLKAPGVSLCKSVAETDFQDYLCMTGVYNALDILSKDEQYGISYLRDDPFYFCDTEEDKYKEPCYTNMIPVVLEKYQNDFYESTRYIEANMKFPNGKSIDDYTNLEMAVIALFHEYVRIHMFDDQFYEKGIGICQSFKNATVRVSCVEGISGGHMKYKNPEQVKDDWVTFCSSENLVEDERSRCFKHVLTRLSIWFSSDEQKNVCNSVPVKYRDYCVLVK